MQIYTLLSLCKSIPYYPHANLYPIIPMQIYTLLSPWHDNPPFPVLPIFTTQIFSYKISSDTDSFLYKDSKKLIKTVV